MERACTICKKIKSLEDFGKSSKGKYGHDAQCKKCKYQKNGRKNFLQAKERCYVNAARWKKKNREQVNQRARERYAIDKTPISNRDRKHYLKRKAQNMVQNRVADGRMVKPSFCSICNCESKRIEGHHADYSKPLEIIWVCSQCHHDIHKSLKERVQPERPNSQDAQ